MRLLDRLNQKTVEDGICETCGNIVPAGKNAIVCKPHDKLILPNYPPYHHNQKCPDWIERK